MRRVSQLVVMTILLVTISAGAALAAVTLTSTSDTYSGNDQPNTIFARGGDDQVNGLGQGDRIFGQADDDDLYGEEGRDSLYGGSGADFLVGGPGEDLFRGNAGNDVVVTGDDKVSDEVFCGLGNDTAYVSGPDHSSLSIHGCENIETFKSFAEVNNPDGAAGANN